MQMYRFVVHGFQRGRTSGSPWSLCEYTFGHKDLRTCESWVQQLIAQTNIEAVRPKNILVSSMSHCPILYFFYLFSWNFVCQYYAVI